MESFWTNETSYRWCSTDDTELILLILLPIRTHKWYILYVSVTDDNCDNCAKNTHSIQIQLKKLFHAIESSKSGLVLAMSMSMSPMNGIFFGFTSTAHKQTTSFVAPIVFKQNRFCGHVLFTFFLLFVSNECSMHSKRKKKTATKKNNKKKQIKCEIRRYFYWCAEVCWTFCMVWYGRNRYGQDTHSPVGISFLIDQKA